MPELLQEFCDSRGVALRVDHAAGLIRGIKVLGLQSRNRREYLPEALSRAISLYEGAKVNVNHPKGHPLAPRDYQERIGVIRNVQHRDGVGLFADFHFNPKHELSEQLIWDAQHAPENVGFSHNVHARTSRRGDTTLVEEILQVHSVDLVADPATTRGLFESTASEPVAQHVDSAIENVAPPESILNEQTTEITALRSEVDHLRARAAIQERRETVLALLTEYRLPPPDAPDPISKAITSPQFVQSLLTAADEKSIRRLIEERARLVQFSQQWQGEHRDFARRPTSRDQTAVESAGIPDAKSFARAIRS